MNHFVTRFRLAPSLVWNGLFLLAMAVSCQPDPGNGVVPTGSVTGCRLLSRTVTVSQPPSGVSAWTYDATGKLVAYNSPYSVGDPAKIDFRYDADDHLTSTINTRVYSGIAGFVTMIDTTGYVYENGRLVQETAYGSQPRVRYEYDQAGSLTKAIYTLYGDTDIDVFSAGKLVDHITQYYGSSTEFHPYEIDDGRIMRHYGGQTRQYYSRYEYDPQGRPTRIEKVNGSTITEYYTVAYTDGKSYYEAISLPKGWPEATRKRFTNAELLPFSPLMPVGLPVRWARFKPMVPFFASPPLYENPLLYENMVNEYTYQKNERGYPLQYDRKTTVYSPNGAAYVSSPVSESYIYAGCR